MLIQSLTTINQTLDNLIHITKQDIEDIKQAKHESLFENNKQKEKLLNQFIQLKSQIDSILVKRSESGLELSKLINPTEDQLLGEFKDKLEQFYHLHKKFAKMAILVTNFYNNLLHKINGCEIDIGYKMGKSDFSNFSLKA